VRSVTLLIEAEDLQLGGEIDLPQRHVRTTSNKGELATQMPRSIAGQAYKNIARRILGEEVPFMTLESTEGFLQWLKRMLKL
jgi:septum formation inhibitor-activating ATPase MinD